VPVVAHTVRVPAPAAGAALSPDGSLLLVADNSGAVVISVKAAEQGSRHAVLGSLVPPGASLRDGVVEVAITPNGQYAFLSMENASQIAVFNLATALADGFGAPGVYLGSIATEGFPVGLAVSPDGRWLYVTILPQADPDGPGALGVLSVARATSVPAAATMPTVPAGCGPVRVLTSANGSVVWVTAQRSDALLAFSAAKVQAGSMHALLADVPVGEAPTGLALARGGTLMVVADSNRYALGIPHGNLAVVNVADALARKSALVGYLPAGWFPRDVAVSANGRLLLVANFASGQVEELNAAAIP
jgi:DNA-binding beta-propeller fold protein YncE